MNAELKRSIGQDFDIDRVIEIACCCRIDGDRVPMPEVISSDEVLLR